MSIVMFIKHLTVVNTATDYTTADQKISH